MTKGIMLHLARSEISRKSQLFCPYFLFYLSATCKIFTGYNHYDFEFRFLDFKKQLMAADVKSKHRLDQVITSRQPKFNKELMYICNK